MFALTIDQHRSRTGEDLVPALLDGLAPVPTVLPFERTVGDEVQGLLDAVARVNSFFVETWTRRFSPATPSAPSSAPSAP